MDFSNKYVLGFALVLCIICSALVSSTAVALKERQDANKELDQRRQVIRVAGLAGAGDALPKEEVDTLFENIQGRVIDRETGTVSGNHDGVVINTDELGRIAAQTAKQVIIQKIREAEQDRIYEEFIIRKGSLVTGAIQRFEGDNIIIKMYILDSN